MTERNDHRPLDDELFDVAVVAALEGAGALPSADLERLEAIDPSIVDEFEYAAGAVFNALAGQGRNAPPAGATDRLERMLESRIGAASANGERLHRTAVDDLPKRTAGSGHERSRADGTRSRGAAGEFPAPAAAGPVGGSLLALSGWAVAAALLAALVMSYTRIGSLEEGLGLGDPTTRSAQLREVAPDAQVLAWATEGVSGDVTWSDARNEGYMRIDGLEVNDPAKAQYQLWIFRGTDLGAEPHPVDGGVFDVSEAEEVTIPIRAKLAVGTGSTFVITEERPGGVVVSDRSNIRAVAQR